MKSRQNGFAGSACASGRGQMAGLFLLSASVLTYELLLMRIFSVLMWYHFASLAIGLAMLGLGAGGLAVGLKPSLGSAANRPKHVMLFGFGALSLLVFLAAVHSWPELAKATLAPFHQPFYKPFARPETAQPGWHMAVRLGALAVGAGWPFFFAGTAISGMLAERAPKVTGAYAATFMGSALGCAILPVMLSWIAAPAAIGFSAALSGVAALFFVAKARGKAVASLLILVGMGMGIWAQTTDGAEIPFARGRFEPNLLAVRWNAMSRVAAFALPPGDTLKPFGQSSAYRGPSPKQIGLVVDDSGYTNLFDGTASIANPDYFRSNLVALPHHLRPGGKALVFGPGGGKDIWIALAFPGTTVMAVEINPQVVEMSEEVFAGFSKRPYSQPGVEVAVTDARRFAAVDKGFYDVIAASAVFGRMPPAAGAFTLSEDLLHTLEGFQDYWNRLDEGGILSITRFAYEQRALRLTALARALLESQGIAEPGRHIRVVTDRGLANVMVSKTPFDDGDDEKLYQLADHYGFNFLYPPGSEADVNQLTRLVDDADFEAALGAISFDVSPPTDDRPFFYYTVRPRDFLGGSLPDRAGFDDRGAEVLRAAIAVMGVLALLVLILPVFLAKGLPRGRGLAMPLIFFASIGLGYMMLEIGIMKRLFLLLGHPVYAVSATLFAFLLGSGIGSLVAGRLAPTKKALSLWMVGTAVLGFIHAIWGPGVATHFMEASLTVRVMVVCISVMIPAFVMGLAFPGAAALLGADSSTFMPWAWAVNGAAGVAATLAAVLIAMNWGFTVTIFAGASLYLVAALAVTGFAQREGG